MRGLLVLAAFFLAVVLGGGYLVAGERAVEFCSKTPPEVAQLREPAEAVARWYWRAPTGFWCIQTDDNGNVVREQPVGVWPS